MRMLLRLGISTKLADTRPSAAVDAGHAGLPRHYQRIEQRRVVVADIADPCANRVRPHQVSGIGLQQIQQFLDLRVVLAEPAPPHVARQDDRHAVVDRRYKLVHWLMVQRGVALGRNLHIDAAVWTAGAAMDAFVLNVPAEQLGWVLALLIAGVFVLIVAAVAFWLSR